MRLQSPKTYFDPVTGLKVDQILALNAAFKADKRPQKINAGVGVLVDEKGRVWVPEAVQKVAAKMGTLQEGGYVVPDAKSEWGGITNFLAGAARMVLGNYPLSKLAAVGTVGGTGAVATWTDAVKMTTSPALKVKALIGEPYYPNHTFILQYRGFGVELFPHLTKTGEFNLAAYLGAVAKAPKKSLLILQGAAHNPTGVNASRDEEWRELARAIRKIDGRVLFDLPYLGLSHEFSRDSRPVKIFLEEGVFVAVAVSFSKIAGLYNQRVGALLIPCSNKETALETSRMLNKAVRANFSSPPAVGEQIMANLFADQKLFGKWQEELAGMALLLHERRVRLARYLPATVAGIVENGAGLFSVLPVAPEKVRQLREKEGIYMLDSGRVNIGGIPLSEMERFGRALQAHFG